MSGHHPGLCPGCAKETLLRDDVDICDECMERHRELNRIDFESEGGKLLKQYRDAIGLRIPEKEYQVIRVSLDHYDKMFDAMPPAQRFGLESLMREGFPSLIIHPSITITAAHREGVETPEYFDSTNDFLREAGRRQGDTEGGEMKPKDKG